MRWMFRRQRGQIREVDIDNCTRRRRRMALGDGKERAETSFCLLHPLRSCVCEKVFSRELREVFSGVLQIGGAGVGHAEPPVSSRHRGNHLATTVNRRWSSGQISLFRHNVEFFANRAPRTTGTLRTTRQYPWVHVTRS